jgi:hypothetical protein
MKSSIETPESLGNGASHRHQEDEEDEEAQRMEQLEEQVTIFFSLTLMICFNEEKCAMWRAHETGKMSGGRITLHECFSLCWFDSSFKYLTWCACVYADS